MIEQETVAGAGPSSRGYEVTRRRMVERQVAARGVSDPRVLEAMRSVPRHAFVADRLHEFAYEDTALPIEAGQTISQPFVVGLMLDAMMIQPGDRVLEVGSGSGYAAAVMSRIAAEVFAVEREPALVEVSRRRFSELGYENVEVKLANGSIGWPEHAPFNAIAVSAGGPRVAETLMYQLAVGGRLLMPVGESQRTQTLVCVTRAGLAKYEEVSLGEVRFVPLIGVEGWASGDRDDSPDEHVSCPRTTKVPRRYLSRRRCVQPSPSRVIREACEPAGSAEDLGLEAVVVRAAGSRVVMIGESSHGTAEFYDTRARITRQLIVEYGYDVVALEADWPDAAAIDRHVRGRGGSSGAEAAFSRFPRWMWRNAQVARYVDWLKQHNESEPDRAKRVTVCGLDLYSLYASIEAVLAYLERVDPEAAADARVRYACFSPWETDPETYGRAAASGRMRRCEEEAVSVQADLLERRLAYLREDGSSLLDAERNAALVRDAERYYRSMYEGSASSWNLRDRHMFETLEAVLAHRGPDARAVVWAHNSHVGDAAATEMGVRGETSIGRLARERFGADCYLIGLGTHRGTVAAADRWGGPVRIKEVRPSHAESYERLFHDTEHSAFCLPLRDPSRPQVRACLDDPRLERAIGVIYRPESEVMSHYFQSSLPRRFDEYIWIDQTSAVEPLDAGPGSVGGGGAAETFPFGV